jgi:hypothetical protein
MSINQRQHIRFSLDIPATLITKFGERQETILQQISIGGCFTGWEEYIYAGDEFRLEIELPNKNRLPLMCKAVYRFDDTGIGVRFTDVSQFEQQLIATIIEHSLTKEGLPVEIDPFSRPAKTAVNDTPYGNETPRDERERMLEEAMSAEVVE